MCVALGNKLLPLLAVSHEPSCCPSECIISDSDPLYILRDSRSCNNKHSRAEPILMAFREMATALLHQRLHIYIQWRCIDRITALYYTHSDGQDGKSQENAGHFPHDILGRIYNRERDTRVLLLCIPEISWHKIR